MELVLNPLAIATVKSSVDSLPKEANKDIKKALKKQYLDEDIYVYKASDKKLTFNGLQSFSLNEDKEIKECFKKLSKKGKVYLYRLKIPKNTNFIGFTNIIFYNNKNMTLPVGMNKSCKILVDINELSIKEKDKKEINVERMENEKNDFSSILLNNIEINELEA